jgi:hypothetical protein
VKEVYKSVTAITSILWDYNDIKNTQGEPGSSVSIVSDYGLGDRAIEVRFPAEAKGFFL